MNNVFKLEYGGLWTLNNWNICLIFNIILRSSTFILNNDIF